MTTIFHNRFAQLVLCMCVILVASEPECSKYSYEEQLLAKMIRVEFKLEQIDEKTTKVRENIQEEMATFNKQWSDQKGMVFVFIFIYQYFRIARWSMCYEMNICDDVIILMFVCPLRRA